MTALADAAERRRLQRRVDRRERVVERPLHEHLPEHLRHEDPPPAGRVEEPRAAPRRRPGEVQRPQDPRLLLDEAQHVALVEGMVAERHAVRPGLEQQRRVRRAQPHAAGGVLAVDHHEIEPPVAPEPRQLLGHRRPAAAAHHVAEKEACRMPDLSAGRIDALLGHDRVELHVVRAVGHLRHLLRGIGEARAPSPAAAPAARRSCDRRSRRRSRAGARAGRRRASAPAARPARAARRRPAPAPRTARARSPPRASTPGTRAAARARRSPAPPPGSRARPAPASPAVGSISAPHRQIARDHRTPRKPAITSSACPAASRAAPGARGVRRRPRRHRRRPRGLLARGAVGHVAVGWGAAGPARPWRRVNP